MMDSLTLFQGRAGDRNDLGMAGALVLANSLSIRVGLPVESVGTPRPALGADWRTELDAAAPGLAKLAKHIAAKLSAGKPITIMGRCAGAIATLPAVVARHPDACVVWFDAHADLNTPDSTSTGYLGGMALSAPAGLWNSGFGHNLSMSNIVLVGTRDIDPFESELIDTGEVRAIAPDVSGIARAVVESVAGRPVYIHLDCDVLEPGQVPSEYQVAGGLSLETLESVFHALSELPLLGLEVAEFQSIWSTDLEPASPFALIEAVWPVVRLLRPRNEVR